MPQVMELTIKSYKENINLLCKCLYISHGFKKIMITLRQVDLRLELW